MPTIRVVRKLVWVLPLFLVATLFGSHLAAAGTADVSIEGHGWGHGVGLSQYGAKALGADGATYEQILHRYFTGVSLVPLAAAAPASFLVTEVQPLWVGLLEGQSGVSFTVSEDSAQLCFDDLDSCVVTAVPGETYRFGYDTPDRCFFQRKQRLGGFARISPTGSCDASVRPVTSATKLFLPRKARSYSDGTLRLRQSSTANGIHVVFQIGLESYLKGVAVAPDSWSGASLRAHVVTVRSTAAWNALERGKVEVLDPGRRADCHCNLYDSDPDLVFRGATEEDTHPNWIAAVDSTRSQVMRTTDGVALGMYSSSSGGVTENYADVFDETGHSHLRSVNDSAAFADSAGNPHDSWGAGYDRAIIAGTYGFSWVSDIEVVNRNDSGSARTIRISGIVDGRPTTVDVSAIDLRNALSLRSTTFDVSMTPLFNDVPPDHPFAGEVVGLVELGITTGCSTVNYCPNQFVTRAEMAAFLVRALDLPAVGGDPYRDDNGHALEAEIASLASSGITSGCLATAYCPDRSVTRAEMAAFLVRGFNIASATGRPFTDVDGHFFEAEIASLASSGITSGCLTTSYCPNRPVTRGEMAAFLIRAIDD